METALQPQTITLLFWLAIILIAAFCLRMACSFFQGTVPSWKRAIISVLIVTLLAYVAFDFTAYIIMRSMDGVFLQVPPGYSFQLWFREALPLKLHIISFAGIFK